MATPVSLMDDQMVDMAFITQRKRKLTAVCSHQTRIGNLDAHLI
ncbi:hypothetical protein AB2S03_25350 [Escherichia coli]